MQIAYDTLFSCTAPRGAAAIHICGGDRKACQLQDLGRPVVHASHYRLRSRPGLERCASWVRTPEPPAPAAEADDKFVSQLQK